ncbi:peptide-methionine (R)-S-oxide reductase MsrB [Fibrella sp. HMF5335]|uniref:peptide-methionine (R)-S-oxide reductase n=1 Tax=Fibrella rubiginis TaxID=2817060 RepID=A0A939GCZ1_9BACT|nr:peptide-methionine (R)-S-oxide reductase MsrB [Fibrella rubiginis]MBO0935255.1 peptide-methionine (R)-S-oxide reductase MsrB [Fibrella rubiginis]
MNYLINSTLAIAILATIACQTNTSAKESAALYSQGQTPPGGKTVTKTDAEWKKQLTPDQYEVLRKHGTERAGTSPLLNVHEDGTFYCAGCHNPLFSYKTKFESGTGWPSFYEPISKNAVKVAKDNSYGMERDEVVCSVCNGHLGHVFNDGPKPTGLRYCMNGVAMTFAKK